MKKILVPVDGSSFSIHAVKVASELALCSGLKLYLLNVQERELPLEHMVAVTGHENYVDYLQEKGWEVINEVKKGFPEGDFICEVKLGEPDEEIVNYAEEIAADIIIMGTHGYSGFAGLLMGSVSTKVIAKSHIPVMTTKDPESIPKRPKNSPIKKSLLGDGELT